MPNKDMLNLVRTLQGEINDLKKQVKTLQVTPHLRNATLDDTSIKLRDREGNLTGVFGKQSDGTFGHTVRWSQRPPTLTAPLLSAAEQAGTAEAGWDGATFFGDPVPVIRGNIEVWAAPVPEDWGEPESWEGVEGPFTGAKRVGIISATNTGGEVLVALPMVGVWAVWIRMVAADGQTMGDWSPAATVEITGNVDTEALNQQLADAAQERQQYIDDFNTRTAEYDSKLAEQDDALAAADAWSAAAMYRTDELSAETAEAKVAASEAAQDAQDAQAKYDQVSSRQDASEAEIAAARAEAAAAHAEAGAAHDYAVTVGNRLDLVGGAIRSTQPPSGVPETGDGTFWRQYDTMASDRQLVGWWEYRDGAWDKLELGLSVLPRVEMGQALADDFRAQRLFAETGEVERLLVSGSDLIPDPKFQDFTWWRGLDESMIGDSSVYGRVLRIDQALIDAAGGQLGVLTRRFEAVPGATYRVVLYANRQGANDNGENDTYRLWVRRLTPTGVWHSSGFIAHQFANDGSGWSQYVYTFTIPEGDSGIGQWELEFRFQDLDGGQIWIADPSTRHMDGELTIEGLLQATEGMIRRLFTDETISRIVWAEIVRAGLLEADEGLIGGVLLKDGAVTLDKLHAIEEIAAALVRTVELEAGTFKTNDMTAMRIVSSLIEATTYLIHNAAGDVSVRLDGVDNFIAGELNTFATPAERDAQLGPNVTLGTSASTISPPIEWRREQDGWMPTPGAWKLDEIDFSNMPTDDPQRLLIHPDLQGRFSRYEVVVRAGVVEARDGPSPLMVLINDRYGTGHDEYRWAARAESADGTIQNASSEASGTFPRMGYLRQYEGHVQVNFSQPGYGDTSYMTWEAAGWVNLGNTSGGWLTKSGGRWNIPSESRLTVTHFGVRPATGADRTWNNNSRAELWGYR